MSNFVSSGVIKYRFAFQVCLQPGHYEIGQETVLKGPVRDTVIDDNVPNSSIEWYTCKGQHVLTGLLIREVSDERDARRGPRRNLKMSYRKKGL